MGRTSERVRERNSAPRPGGLGRMKTIIIHDFSDKEINEFINHYKKNEKLPKVIFATVTETTKEMKVKDILKELEEEHRELSKE